MITIHCQAEYYWGRFRTLWVSPPGSVTVGATNNRDRLVRWWPVNWIIGFPLVLAIKIYIRMRKS